MSPIAVPRTNPARIGCADAPTAGRDLSAARVRRSVVLVLGDQAIGGARGPSGPLKSGEPVWVGPVLAWTKVQTVCTVAMLAAAPDTRLWPANRQNMQSR